MVQDRSSTETLELSDGRRLRPGVCRTAYVFPGIGLGVTMSRSTRIRDEMIIAAAEVSAVLVRGAYACLTSRVHSIFCASVHSSAPMASAPGPAGDAPRRGGGGGLSRRSRGHVKRWISGVSSFGLTVEEHINPPQPLRSTQPPVSSHFSSLSIGDRGAC